MQKKELDVSIVIPTYNEVENIKILIPEVENLLKKLKLHGEIIIVDDTSPDGTANAARLLNNKYKNVVVIDKEKKEGIGSALRVGYNNAQGTLILSSDADLSFRVDDMESIIKKLNDGYDLVVGSRHLIGGEYQKKTFSTQMKGFVSFVGNIAARKVSGINIHDFSANFRGVRNHVWNSIETRENTNSILFEMILKTHHKGYKVTEIPVVFRERVHGESKLNLGVEAPKFLMRLFYHTFTIRFSNLFSKKQPSPHLK